MDRHQTPEAELRALEEWYTDSINVAVAQDRYDVVDELAVEFDIAASRLRVAA